MSHIYRPCASAIVFNSKGLVLLGNRIDTKDDAWQFSQGGIEQGESPAIAAKRELFEEMSVKSVELIYVGTKPFRYEFPDEIKLAFRQRGIFASGQDIYFSLFYFTGNDDEINVQTEEPEFIQFKWDTLDFAVNNVVEFKKQAYSHAAAMISPLIYQHLCHLT